MIGAFYCEMCVQGVCIAWLLKGGVCINVSNMVDTET